MRSTFEGLEQFDDVGVVEHGHGVDLLQQETLELRILDHLPLGDALYGVEGRRGGRLRGQQHVPETALAQSSDGVELIAI
jgi:hypothetical protein